MSPGLVVGVAVGAALVGLLIGLALARAHHLRALERLAADQQNTVGLYLRRKVAESNLDPGDALQARGAAETLSSHVHLAEALLSHERRAMELGDTQELGLARTMRLPSTSEIDAASK